MIESGSFFHRLAEKFAVALGARDTERIAEVKRLKASILPRLGQVPIRELEAEIGADRIDYSGESPYYSGPKSMSQMKRQEERRGKKVDKILRRHTQR